MISEVSGSKMKSKYWLIALGLGALLGVTQIKDSQAQEPNKRAITAYVEGVQSENNPASFIRPNVFYTLPGDLNAYSFGEFYRDEGYFGKTNLNREIKHGIKPGTELVYGSGFNDRAGLGINYQVPRLPKGSSLSVKTIPFWFDKNGYIDDRLMIGYFGSIDFPYGISLSSFGEINLRNKNGPQWGYGEVSLTKRLNHRLGISYNPLLKNDGNLSPKLEHAVSVRLDL